MRFVIALRSNDSAMRYRLLKAIQSGALAGDTLAAPMSAMGQ